MVHNTGLFRRTAHIMRATRDNWSKGKRDQLEIEVRIRVAGDLLVGHHDVLDVLVDEVVERDEVLLDQTAHLQ